MINVRYKTEKMEVFEYFVNELSKDLNVTFEGFKTTFQRGKSNGKKYKVKTFTSEILKYKSFEYELSFIPYSDDSIELWIINVRNRGLGLGTELMNKVLDVSDRTGIKVKLVPIGYDSDKNTPKEYDLRLSNWYSIGFGFRKSKFSFDPYYTYYPEQEYKMVG